METTVLRTAVVIITCKIILQDFVRSFKTSGASVVKRRKSKISLATWYKNVINISITQKTGIFVHCRWECKIVLQPKSDKRKKAKISTQGNNTGVDLIKPLQV